MKPFLKIAFRSLFRNKRRNVATALAIAFGYAGLLLLGGYILRVERYLKVNAIYLNRSGHISIYKQSGDYDGLDRFLTKPKHYLFTAEEQKRIEERLSFLTDEVEFTAKYLNGIGLASNGNKTAPFFALGVEPKIENRLRNHPLVKKWTPELVRPENGKDLGQSLAQAPDAVALTPGLAALIGKTSESLGSLDLQLIARSFSGDFAAVDAQVVSQFTTGLALSEDSGLIAPLGLLQNLYDTDGITYFAIFLKPGVSIEKFRLKLAHLLAKDDLHAALYPFDYDKISLFYVGTMSFLYVMMGFFVFLVFGVVALSIINSMTMGILERTREIGALRALGFSPSYITSLFAAEGTLLAIGGLAVGALLAQVVAKLVNSENIRFNPPGIAGDMQFVLTPDLELCLALFVPIFLVSGVAAYLTASKKSKSNIATLMTTAST